MREGKAGLLWDAPPGVVFSDERHYPKEAALVKRLVSYLYLAVYASDMFAFRLALAVHVGSPYPLISCLQLIEFKIAEVLDIDHLIVRLVDGPDQFVQFEIDGARVAVLRVLNEEDHQERDDGCAGVDHQLPGVRKVKNGTGDRPEYDYQGGAGKCPSGPDKNIL